MDIQKLAALVRLEISPCEQERIKREIKEFADMAAVLDGFCEAESLECTEASCDAMLREDTPSTYDGDVLSCAPSVYEHYVTVPLTVKEGADDK